MQSGLSWGDSRMTLVRTAVELVSLSMSPHLTVPPWRSFLDICLCFSSLYLFVHVSVLMKAIHTLVLTSSSHNNKGAVAECEPVYKPFPILQRCERVWRRLLYRAVQRNHGAHCKVGNGNYRLDSRLL